MVTRKMRAFACVGIILLIGLHLCLGCEEHERKFRCRITYRMCSCDDFACRSEYRYESLDECQRALKGQKSDPCKPNPCMHEGSCIQITQSPAFKCRCEGTGYFGQRCNRACPRPGASYYSGIFPYECVVI